MRQRLLNIFAILVLLTLAPLTALFAQVSEDDLLKQITPQEGALAKGDLEEPFKIAVDADINLNYVFAESPDTFIVNYKIHLEGLARNKVDVIKGKGQVTASVKGFLAKWPTGECQLNISVSEVPFEIVFSQTEEESAHIDVKISETILENWESNCKFVDAPNSKLNTRGNPEKWLDQAVKRISPPLRDNQLPIDRLHKKTTTLKLSVERFLIPDPPLGSVEMEGKGTLSIIPES